MGRIIHRRQVTGVVLAWALALVACGPGGGGAPIPYIPDSGPTESGYDAGPRFDAGPHFDAGEHDAGLGEDAGHDAGSEIDAGTGFDAGPEVDAGTPFDAGPPFDAGTPFDAGPEEIDAGSHDAGSFDAGHSGFDAGPHDAGPEDAGMSCVPETPLQFCETTGMECSTVVGVDNCGEVRTEECGVCATFLAQGDFILIGATADDYVIVQDRGTGAYSAVQDVMGSTVQGLGVPAGNSYALVSDTTVFVWVLYQHSPQLGDLYTWDSSNLLEGPVSNSVVGFAAANQDESAIAYTSNAAIGSTITADLIGAAPGLMSPVTLLIGTAWNTSTGASCYPPGTSPVSALIFAGNYLVFSHCLTTQAKASISSWNWNASWSVENLATATSPLVQADENGTTVSFTDSTTPPPTLNVVPIAGGTVTSVPDYIDLSSAYILSMDAELLYVNTHGKLETASLQGTQLDTLSLVSSGVVRILGATSDLSNVAYATQLGSSPLTDAWFWTEDSSTPTEVVSQPTAYITALAPFTNDESYALYLSNATTSGTGTFAALPVGGGSVPTVVGSDVRDLNPITGTVVLFADNVLPSNLTGGPNTVDLESVDVSTPTGPSKLARQVDESFVLTSDGNIVYVISASSNGQPSIEQGLYVIPQPQ